MAMIGKVRRMHFRQGKSVRDIVRLTSQSRNTASAITQFDGPLIGFDDELRGHR